MAETDHPVALQRIGEKHEEEDPTSIEAIGSGGLGVSPTSRRLAGLFSEEESPLLSRLDEAAKAIRELEILDPATRDFTQGFENARAELEDLSVSLSRYLDNLDFDAGEQSAVESRLDILSSLKRKYGPSVDDVLVHRENANPIR